MLSRWPRWLRQWYCWAVSISEIFCTHTSARLCLLDLMPAPAPSFWFLMTSVPMTINSSSCRGLTRLLKGLRQYVPPSTSATVGSDRRNRIRWFSLWTVQSFNFDCSKHHQSFPTLTHTRSKDLFELPSPCSLVIWLAWSTVLPRG